jgi:hypothetical protein
VGHTFNPSTQETEAGGSLSSRLAWSTEHILGQPELQRETLFQKKKKNERGRETRRKVGRQEGNRFLWDGNKI